MQTVLNSVWSARMKGSFKVIFMNEVDITLLTRCILSAGFIGLQETSLLPASFIYSVFLSKEFHDEKDRNSTGTTMSSIRFKSSPSITIFIRAREDNEIKGFKSHSFKKIFLISGKS